MCFSLALVSDINESAILEFQYCCFCGGHMFRTFSAVILCACLLFAADYASATKMKSFWKSPAATAASMQCKKVLVIAAIKQSTTRKVAEDKAVAIIEAGGSAHAVPSYTFLPENELDDKEAAKSKITSMDFDGVIIMHSAGSKDRKRYDPEVTEAAESPGPWYSYQDFWGFYGGLGAVYNATTTNDLFVYIETMFYSLKDNQLVWAGITETKNPKNPAKVVGEIAEETAKYLQKNGLIAKSKK